METIIKNLTSHIIEEIIADFDLNNARAIELVLNAYNRYQEDERDGVDYLFNINYKYDLKCCVEGGLTASEIARLYDETTQGATPLFLFGVNYERPKHITNWEEAKKILLGVIDDVVLYAIAFHAAQGYKAFFDYYIADYVLNNMTEAK